MLSSFQRDYVERVISPKSPEDLALALQNPASPAYKELMNMLMQQLQIYLIIETLCQHYLRDAYQASQAEKEAVLNQLTAKEIPAQPKMKEPKPTVSVSNISAHQCKQRLKELVDSMLDLENERDDILDSQQKARAQHEREWKEFTEQQMQNYTETLQEKNLQFAGENGRMIHPNSIQGQKIIQAAFTAPSPEKIKRIVEDAYLQAETAKSASLPRPTPAFRVAHHGVLCAIRALGALTKHSSNEERFKLLKKNQSPLTALANVEGRVLGVQSMIEKDDVLYNNEMKQLEQIQKLNDEIRQTTANFLVVDQKYTELTGEKYEPNVAIKEKIEEKSKLRPRPQR